MFEGFSLVVADCLGAIGQGGKSAHILAVRFMNLLAPLEGRC